MGLLCFFTKLVILKIAAVLHWDFKTLLCGIIYWVAIPSNFMFLQIFMLANINDVSWGTRSGVVVEKKKKLTLKQKIESYYKGKPYPGISSFFRYIWYGEGMYTK
jgi:cellulose synthase/poly-beta-1,6-N-acetylglucosamine synthase-like glycosyltransferase